MSGRPCPSYAPYRSSATSLPQHQPPSKTPRSMPCELHSHRMRVPMVWSRTTTASGWSPPVADPVRRGNLQSDRGPHRPTLQVGSGNGRSPTREYLANLIGDVDLPDLPSHVDFHPLGPARGEHMLAVRAPGY